MRAANLALKFGLELAAIAAFAYWGTTLGGTAVSALVAVAAPLVAASAWVVALVFAVLVAVNSILLTSFDQWDQ